MRKSLILLAMALTLPHWAIPTAYADETGVTTTVVPNSTVVTIVPNSTTITLPAGVSLPAGATLITPPGAGAAGTTSSAPTSTVTTSSTFEVDPNNLGSLTAEQRAAVAAAMSKAEATTPTQSSQSAPSIPSSIAGLTPEMLSHLTPEQMKLVEQAKSTGTIPTELKGMLANIADVPGDIYAKLSDQQKSILDSARASGFLDKSMINDILDGLTPAEVKAFTSGQSISTTVVKTAVAKRSIICTNGKKTITLAATTCPKGYKKK